jgi:hypothetical protein
MFCEQMRLVKLEPSTGTPQSYGTNATRPGGFRWPQEFRLSNVAMGNIFLDCESRRIHFHWPGRAERDGMI